MIAFLRRMPIQYKWIIALSIFIPGCRSGSHQAKMTTQNGVMYIENTEHGIWPANKIVVKKDHMSIGNEKNDAQLFHNIEGVATSSDNHIYVLDSGNFRVAVFDENGFFLFKFGSIGSGPGEFRHPIDMEMDKNNNIYVLDYANKRIDKFNRQGKYVFSSKLKIVAHDLAILQEDKVLLTEIRMGSYGAFGWYKNLTDGPETETLQIELPFKSDVIVPKGTSISLEEKFQTLSDGHIYLSIPFPYEIRKYTPSNNLVSVISKTDPRIQAPTIELFESKMNRGKYGISIEENGKSGPCFLHPAGYLINNCTWFESEKIK